jgi:ubiquitin carboxyl-terminal hydrolase 9/13
MGAINGKEKDSEKSMMGWLRRRSLKNMKPRQTSETNSDIPPLPQDLLIAPGSPVRNQSTSSSSNSSKDSRLQPDSPTPGHPSPRLSNGKSLPFSRTVEASPHRTNSKHSFPPPISTTSPTFPSPDRRSQPRLLPSIPASPQTPKAETPSSLSARKSLDHSRVPRRLGIPSSLHPLPSPKLPGRPATSAGAPARAPSLLPSVPTGNGLRVPDPNIPTSGLGISDDFDMDRPQSAYASYTAVSPPHMNTTPLVLVDAAEIPRKRTTRKLSLSTPMLGFKKRDKDRL